jgi:adenylate cyclase class 2
MSEIEIKVLDIDPDRIREKLVALGATQVKQGRETNRMYDFPDERLWEAGSYLRVRSFGPAHTMTFKRRLAGAAYKTSEEIETTVGDPGAIGQVLESLGLVQRRVDEKDRESWKLGDILFEIDRWPSIPPYLEIEAPTEAQVEEGLRLLDIPRDDKVTSARLDEILRRYYGREVPANLKF